MKKNENLFCCLFFNVKIISTTHDVILLLHSHKCFDFVYDEKEIIVHQDVMMINQHEEFHQPKLNLLQLMYLNESIVF